MERRREGELPLGRHEHKGRTAVDLCFVKRTFNDAVNPNVSVERSDQLEWWEKEKRKAKEVTVTGTAAEKTASGENHIGKLTHTSPDRHVARGRQKREEEREEGGNKREGEPR